MKPSEIIAVCEKVYAALKASETAGKIGVGMTDRLAPIVLDHILRNEGIELTTSFKQ